MFFIKIICVSIFNKQRYFVNDFTFYYICKWKNMMSSYV